MPALVVNANAIIRLKRDELDGLLARAVDNLPLADRNEILGLSTHDGARTQREKVGKIFRVNSFSTGFHPCRPNCAYFFYSNTFSERQRQLNGWEFKCSCERCSATATQVAESDGNITEIRWPWGELGAYSAFSLATPATAERLISLYRREGLKNRIQEAHFRAAVEWIGVGDIEKASEHATLCIKYGRLFKGPDRPFIKKMEQLLEIPTSHPHWIFRLKHADMSWEAHHPMHSEH
ncbi:hypothetical protein GGR55DRAFT_690250 [Xylaria sp. FL0064]|nr:hypothetical protein GGR55DRAFT_690250 [Xylaria sp. FL0064]